MTLLITLTILMLALLMLTRTLRILTSTLALLPIVMLASVASMMMRLRLDRDQKVLPRLANSMNQALISVWPLAFELFLLVVLGEGLLLDFVVEEAGLCGFVGVLADWIGAFDFGVLDSADTIVVVVDCGLQNCSTIY